MLLRSAMHSVTRDVFGGLAVGAGAALISNLMTNSQRQAYAPAGNFLPAENAASRSGSNGAYIANIALARIALCYYIAKSDGYISPDEQRDLDYMCSSLLNNPNASPSFRSELQKIASDTSTSFLSVEKYLNNLNLDTLNQLQADMQRIAEITDGVTENERKAMMVFQNYIYGKQGFPGGNMNEQFAGRARVVTLKCPGCGATQEINDSRTETYCPYCGTKQVIMH
ncbi:MAG: TFIIB-type zinc ribbon-containing protein [Clostridiales bacterium]|nr:TFIIB-type zinc ribbon-containing protein [Clostridiales bacterium]